MRQSSNNSFATSTNIRFGSKELPEVWWNVNVVELPSISFDGPRQNTRPGAMSNLAADTCSFTDFTVELHIDKDWKTYSEVYRHFLEGLNVKNAKFSHYKTFDLWVEFVDGKGDVKQKFWLYNCRLIDFGGVVATPNDGDDTLQVMTMTFSVLYFEPEGIAD